MSNQQSIEGALIQILKVESGVGKSGKEWTKQEFVVETQEQFPKKVCFTLFGDKTSLLNLFREGDQVNVSYNLESRDFNGKWYHNINCWKLDKVNSGTQTTGSQNNYQSADQGTNLPASEMATQDQIQDDGGDDLPF